MNNAKEAANAFVDALLPEGNEYIERIAVVSYSSSGYGKVRHSKIQLLPMIMLP